MQYVHGISPSSALPFSPPTAFRRAKRKVNHKNEKSTLLEGHCHRCGEWAPMEGVKCVEAKVCSSKNLPVINMLSDYLCSSKRFTGGNIQPSAIKVPMQLGKVLLTGMTNWVAKLSTPMQPRIRRLVLAKFRTRRTP